MMLCFIIVVIAAVAFLSSRQGQAAFSNSDNATAVLTGLLALVGIGQFFLFWWQLHLIRQSLRDTMITAQAAKSSADASKLQMRAYLALTTDTPIPKHYGGLAIGADWSVNVVLFIKNTGQTPAYDVTSKIFVLIDNVGMHDRLPMKSRHDPALINGGMLNPGEAISSRRKFLNKFKPMEIEWVRNGIKAFYIFGTIEFCDVFNERRWINFQLTCSGEYTDVSDLHLGSEPIEPPKVYKVLSISGYGLETGDIIPNV
jgi:hypothetical protein